MTSMDSQMAQTRWGGEPLGPLSSIGDFTPERKCVHNYMHVLIHARVYMDLHVCESSGTTDSVNG